MGKPAGGPAPGIAGSSSDADAVSLHTHRGDRAFDDDVPELRSDDLPPLYSEIEADTSSNAPLLPSIGTLSYTLPVLDGGMHKVDAITGAESFISSLLDADPTLLEQQIMLSGEKPPRYYVRILGTHSQMVDDNGKKQKRIVTDFDVSVELTPYLFSDAANRVSWRELRTVENSVETRRGTILRKRAPGVERDIEAGTGDKPTLAEWCHRYCASHAGVKCFALRRRVAGFDEKHLKQKLEALVRGTNYRGNVYITFRVKDKYARVFNNCWVNRWRLTPWIFWLCILTFLWLLTWPFLFFRTKKFEVVVADWPFSVTDADGRKRYVSMSEDHIYNLWGRAINRAVLDKRQGTLDQTDLIASQTASSEPFANVLEGAARFLRDGINAITAVNRQLGWGGDS